MPSGSQPNFAQRIQVSIVLIVLVAMTIVALISCSRDARQDEIFYDACSLSPIQPAKVYESSFLPVDATSSYREEDGLWHTRARSPSLATIFLECGGHASRHQP